MAVTNAQASRELDRSEYAISAKLDLNNIYSENVTISAKSPANEISVKVLDSTTLVAGDTISFTVQNTGVLGGEVFHTDGTKVGDVKFTLTGLTPRRIAEAIGSSSTVEQWQAITHETAGPESIGVITFNENASKYDTLDLTYTWKAYSLLARTSEDALVPVRILDSTGAELAKKMSRTEVVPATTDTVLNNTADYLQWGTPANYDLSKGDDSLEMGRTTEVVIANLDEPGEIKPLKSGTLFTWDFTQNQNTPFLVRAVDTKLVGSIIELSSIGVVTSVGSPQNNDGYWRNPDSTNRFEIIENSNDKLVLKALNDVSHIAFSMTGLTYNFDLTKMDDTVIDPATGEFKELPVVHTKIISYTGMTLVDNTSPLHVTYIGSWSNAEGDFSPKYASILNAVLEDGTVIKQ